MSTGSMNVPRGKSAKHCSLSAFPSNQLFQLRDFLRHNFRLRPSLKGRFSPMSVLLGGGENTLTDVFWPFPLVFTIITLKMIMVSAF